MIDVCNSLIAPPQNTIFNVISTNPTNDINSLTVALTPLTIFV